MSVSLKIHLTDSSRSCNACVVIESKIRSSTTQKACVQIPFGRIGTTMVGYGVKSVNNSSQVKSLLIREGDLVRMPYSVGLPINGTRFLMNDMSTAFCASKSNVEIGSAPSARHCASSLKPQ